MRRRYVDNCRAKARKRLGRRLCAESLEARRYLHGDAENADLALVFCDPVVPYELLDHQVAPAFATTEPASAMLSPLTSIPILNSLPLAAATLYLDFDGHFESYWFGYFDITTPVFDQDGDFTTFSASELAAIHDIWQIVSEDYAPFNINVTTVEPPSFDNGVALRISIGGDGAWTGGTYGGVSSVDSFTSPVGNTAFVFSDNLGHGTARYVGESASHEAGHAFGLQHHSQFDADGVKIAEYYRGPGDGTAPIMGNSYYTTRGLWWNGPSTSATTIQDDMAVIAKAANGFGYQADDHSDDAASATPLTIIGNQLSSVGLINSTSDIDYFSFTTDAGDISLSADVIPNYNNLDARIELRDASGTLLASTSPSDSFGGTLNATVAAGSYRLVVESSGGYGNVGTYTVSGTIASKAAAVVAAQVFYNNSKFDDNNPAAGAADDAAIAFDKSALRPGSAASFVNYTSYSRGINGVMLDVSDLPGTVTADDFSFRIGNDNDPANWLPAPRPTSIVTRTGAGLAGSSRVELIWADGTITNTWLQITVQPTMATGLVRAEVFYFGNAIGESGDDSANAMVNATDEVAVRAHPSTFMNPAVVDSPYDFDRDGFVNATDQILTRVNASSLTTALKLIDTPPPLNLMAEPIKTVALHGLAAFAATLRPAGAPDTLLWAELFMPQDMQQPLKNLPPEMPDAQALPFWAVARDADCGQLRGEFNLTDEELFLLIASDAAAARSHGS